MAINVGELLATLGIDTSKFSTGLKSASAKTAAFGRNMRQVGSDLTLGVTVPLALLGGAAVKAAADFESSFAGVRKTVDATVQEFARLEKGFRNLSKEIPVNVNELNRIGEAAGQLGIPQERILEFTEVIAKLGVTTNLSAEQGATALARFANITGGVAATNFEQLGSVLVELGNNFATTEAEIAGFGLRIAGAANQIGLTQDQILAFGAALSSVGVNAEAGGSAISRTFIKIAEAVDIGGDKLDEFARVAGLSSEQFAAAFEQDAARAVQAFIEGLGNLDESGESVFAVLDSLELQEIRLRDALLRTAGAGDLLGEALDSAAMEAGEMNALTTEAEQRFQTFESQLSLVGNRLKDTSITLGQALLPILLNVLDTLGPFINKLADWAAAFGKLSPTTQTVIVGLAALLAAAGPVLVIVGQLTIAASALAPLFAGAGAALSGVLVPALAAAAVGIAAFKITDWILEWTGLREKIDAVARALLGVKGELGPSEQDLAAIQRANELFGMEFESVQQATAALNTYNAVLRETQSESAALAAATAEISDELAGSSLTTALDSVSSSFKPYLANMGSARELTGAFGVQVGGVIGQLNRMAFALDSLSGKLKDGFSAIFSGGFQSIFQNILGLAGPIAALSGPIIGLIGGLFSGRDAQTVMEEAGRDMGVSLSEGLAKQINESGKNIQLMLPEIFAEGNLGLDRLAEETGDIFSGIEQGLFSTQEASEALARTVPILIENFDSLGTEGMAQVQRIIEAAKRLGIEFEGLDELTALFGNGMRLSADDAIQAFLDMGGAADAWSAHLQKSATDAARAMERLARIMARVQAGLDLNPTQLRFLGNIGLDDVPQMQHGGFVPARPGGTLVRVGEGREDEFVVPASKMGAGGMGGVNLSVTVNAPPGTDVPGLIRAIEANTDNLATRAARKLRQMGEIA